MPYDVLDSVKNPAKTLLLVLEPIQDKHRRGSCPLLMYYHGPKYANVLHCVEWSSGRRWTSVWGHGPGFGADDEQHLSVLPIEKQTPSEHHSSFKPYE